MSTTPDNEIQPIISATEDRVSEDVRKEIKEQRHVGFVIQESNTSVSSATDASLNEVKETKTAIEGSPGESAVRQIDFLQEHRSGVNVYDHYEEIKLLGSVLFASFCFHIYSITLTHSTPLALFTLLFIITFD